MCRHTKRSGPMQTTIAYKYWYRCDEPGCGMWGWRWPDQKRIRRWGHPLGRWETPMPLASIGAKP